MWRVRGYAWNVKRKGKSKKCEEKRESNQRKMINVQKQ